MDKMKMLNRIVYHCDRSKESYFTEFKDFVVEPVTGHRYIYIPRGGNVLAVAHLDCVSRTPQSQTASLIPAGKNHMVGVNSINLDDRLGAWIILEGLTSVLGIKDFDILLTDEEEIGLSTAGYFETDKEYNWIFEFDRHGTRSAVLYQYDEPEIRTKLESCDITVEKGLFSDICDLQHLNITAINFACGYYQEHTLNCFAFKDNILASLWAFKTFWNKFSKVRMEIDWTGKNWSDEGWAGDDWKEYDWTGKKWADDDDDDEILPLHKSPYADYCSICGLSYHPDDLVDGICTDCISWMNGG